MLHEISPRSLHIEYEAKAANAEDYIFIIKDGMGYLRDDEEALILPRRKELNYKDEELQFLFCVDREGFYLYTGSQYPSEDDIYSFVKIRDIRRYKPVYMSYAVQLCYRLYLWYQNNAFCGRCGCGTVHSKIERALVCPSCKNTIYPAISPSVIVLIRDGERTLLTRYQATHNFYRNYALVAGYVETGETPETAVAREVFEEVGLRVKNITYYKSQPWPLSGALLLGYVCDLDGDDTIVRDDGELEEALWVDRAQLPDRSQDVSLTSELIEMFRIGKL